MERDQTNERFTSQRCHRRTEETERKRKYYIKFDLNFSLDAKLHSFIFSKGIICEKIVHKIRRKRIFSQASHCECGDTMYALLCVRVCVFALICNCVGRQRVSLTLLFTQNIKRSVGFSLTYFHSPFRFGFFFLPPMRAILRCGKGMCSAFA